MAKENSYSPNWQAPEEPGAGLERTDRVRDGDSAAGARAHALAADVAAARVALQAEQRRSKELEGALADRSSTLAVVRSTVEELLRESERHKSELRTLRESLAARDARLSALQQEHAKIVPAPGATARSTAHRDAELQAARADAGALASELKTSRETVAALTAQIKRRESEVNAARAEMNTANSQAGSYLELLRTHEWRRGFDQNMFRELDALTGAADLGQAEQATQIAQLRAEQAAQIERLQAEADQREEEMGVLMTHLQEARRPIQAFEADFKRLSEELAAKDAAAAEFEEENRNLRATLERTRGSLEEREIIIRTLERSERDRKSVV